MGLLISHFSYAVLGCIILTPALLGNYFKCRFLWEVKNRYTRKSVDPISALFLSAEAVWDMHALPTVAVYISANISLIILNWMWWPVSKKSFWRWSCLVRGMKNRLFFGFQFIMWSSSTSWSTSCHGVLLHVLWLLLRGFGSLCLSEVYIRSPGQSACLLIPIDMLWGS